MHVFVDVGVCLCWKDLLEEIFVLHQRHWGYKYLVLWSFQKWLITLLTSQLIQGKSDYFLYFLLVRLWERASNWKCEENTILICFWGRINPCCLWAMDFMVSFWHLCLDNQRVFVLLPRKSKCRKYLIVINWRPLKLSLSGEYIKTVDMYDEITGC